MRGPCSFPAIALSLAMCHLLSIHLFDTAYAALPSLALYKAVGLPKLDGVTVNKVLRAVAPHSHQLINPIDNVTVRPGHIGAFFHRSFSRISKPSVSTRADL
jgi:hypothetical protein